MSNLIKIQNGTPPSNEHICRTCRYGQIIEGNNFEQMTMCGYYSKQVSFQVAKCSKWDDSRLPALWEMEKIAWKVESRIRGSVGFTPRTEMDIVISPPAPKQAGTPDGA